MIVHIPLYIKMRVSLMMKWKRFITALGFGWHMPAKFQMVVAIKPLILVSNLWSLYVTVRKKSMYCSIVAAIVQQLYVNIKKVKPTVLFAHITDGAMHWMVHYVVYLHLKVMVNVWINQSFH
ncbi:hypothetical protein D3C75_1061140 [compost metagenome]